MFVGLLSGIYIGHFTSLPVSTFVYALVVCAGAGFVHRRTIGLLFLCGGVLLGLVRVQPVATDFMQLASLEGEATSVIGVVKNDPVYHDSGQYQFHITELEINGRGRHGEMRIRSFVNDVVIGDKVKVSGKVRDGFASWQASMYYAETQVISRDSSLLGSWRAQFISDIYSGMPDPEASLGLGFLIGIRALLPDSLDEQLSVTGLTHIVAVSGYNLTIMATMSRRVFEKRSRFQSVLATCLMLFSFVTITGISPSVLRALVVSLFSLGAWYYGRDIKPWRLLLYSSAISACIFPQYTWTSIGWYLSLTAFFGVLVIAPAIQLRILKTKKPGILRQVLVETSSAQLTTAPIILFIFGEASLIALLANALVLPLIPFAMLTTFLAGISIGLPSVISAPVVQISYIILQYITSVITILSSLTWALVEIGVSLRQFVYIYGVIGIFSITLWRRSKTHQSDILKPY